MLKRSWANDSEAFLLGFLIEFWVSPRAFCTSIEDILKAVGYFQKQCATKF